MLRRDLIDPVVREGTQGCKVDAGTLAEPCTGAMIFFVEGSGPAAQIEGGSTFNAIARANAQVLAVRG